MDDPAFRARAFEADLIANARGVAYAAFAPVATIAERLGCTANEAHSLQQTAIADFNLLMVRVAQAKNARAPR